MHRGTLGLACRDLRDHASALAMFGVALPLNPGYAPAFDGRANVLFDMGRDAAALPLYDGALAPDASCAVVHHNKGVCLQYLGRIEEAGGCFQRALAIDPHYAYSIEELKRLGAP